MTFRLIPTTLLMLSALSSAVAGECPAPQAQAVSRSSEPEWAARHQRIVEQSGTNRPAEVMIGDSLIQFMPGDLSSRLFGKAPLNAGIASDQTTNVIWRARQMDFSSARRITLLAGINDLTQGRRDPASVAASLLFAVQTLHERAPQAHVTLVKILPTIHGPATGIGKSIAATNRLIDQCMPQAAWLSVSDPGAGFVDTNGAVQPDLLIDWAHLSPKGYARLFEALSRSEGERRPTP